MFNDTFTALLREYLLSLNPGAMSDRKAVAGLLNDIIPHEPKLRRVLMYLHELGICDEIADCDALTDTLMRRFRARLQDEFGMSGKHANWGIYIWCTCYGRDVLGKPYEMSAMDSDYAAITSQIKMLAKKEDAGRSSGARVSAETVPEPLTGADNAGAASGAPTMRLQRDGGRKRPAKRKEALDADALWSKILAGLSESPGDVKTVKKEGIAQRWFFAFTKEGIVFAGKAMTHSPSAELETPISVTKSEFEQVFPLYASWRDYKITGEQASEISEKVLFIFALIHKFI